ncbi:MAG TPA: flagellar basal-body rod protein FlgG [Tepidisphaeraceae bacterium]|nr:flagellar basal-body rod protein FlgG [Tepidisphaeraceae bacterium]
MAITALYAAATGLKALSTRIDVTANNLANAETTAFKRSRVNFEDLMYLTLKQPGTTSGQGEVSPAGIFVGLGTKISNTQVDLEQGSLERTDGPLDVGIEGDGFFKVKVLDTVGDGTAYTRNGNFFRNKDGELVLGMGDGYKLVPPVSIPDGTIDVSISLDGTIAVQRAGQTTKQVVGQLQLSQFVNPNGLKLLGGSLYQETESSGTPITGRPGENGAGQILHGYLESSNVDPVKELVNLIKTQRSFELNSQSIQSADQALQVIGNLRRG